LKLKGCVRNLNDSNNKYLDEKVIIFCLTK